jgi:hypothetical protein
MTSGDLVMHSAAPRAEDHAMTTTTRLVRTSSAALLLLASAWGLACRSTSGEESGRSPPDVLAGADFAEPVEDARAEDVTVYWLGQEFDAGGQRFILYPVADFTDDDDSRYPGLSFDYFAAAGGGGTVRTGFEMYSKAGSGSQIMLDRAAAVQGASAEEVTVGKWSSTLFTLPSPSRPVNKLYLFVDFGDTMVIVQASSGRTGVLGTDPNLLIDKDLLIQTVAENLRPYPL